MATLEQIKKSSFGSHTKQTFIETEPGSKTYNLMNIRGDANTWETGSSTETISDVTQKVQPNEVSAYAPSLSVSQLALADDPVYQMFEEMFDEGAVGGNAHRNIIRVKLNDALTEIVSVFKADATVQVTSFPNEAGTNSKVEATITAVSDWEEIATSAATLGDGIITLS